jgi:hypothetical protein
MWDGKCRAGRALLTWQGPQSRVLHQWPHPWPSQMPTCAVWDIQRLRGAQLGIEQDIPVMEVDCACLEPHAVGSQWLPKHRQSIPKTPGGLCHPWIHRFMASIYNLTIHPACCRMAGLRHTLLAPTMSAQSGQRCRRWRMSLTAMSGRALANPCTRKRAATCPSCRCNSAHFQRIFARENAIERFTVQYLRHGANTRTPDAVEKVRAWLQPPNQLAGMPCEDGTAYQATEREASMRTHRCGESHTWKSSSRQDLMVAAAPNFPERKTSNACSEMQALHIGPFRPQAARRRSSSGQHAAAATEAMESYAAMQRSEQSKPPQLHVAATAPFVRSHAASEASASRHVRNDAADAHSLQTRSLSGSNGLGATAAGSVVARHPSALVRCYENWAMRCLCCMVRCLKLMYASGHHNYFVSYHKHWSAGSSCVGARCACTLLA